MTLKEIRNQWEGIGQKEILVMVNSPVESCPDYQEVLVILSYKRKYSLHFYFPAMLDKNDYVISADVQNGTLRECVEKMNQRLNHKNRKSILK